MVDSLPRLEGSRNGCEHGRQRFFNNIPSIPLLIENTSKSSELFNVVGVGNFWGGEVVEVKGTRRHSVGAGGVYSLNEGFKSTYFSW